MRYYLAINGETQGPYPQEDIEAMVRDGQIPPDTQAVHEGGDQWVPLASLIPVQPAPPAQPTGPRQLVTGAVPHAGQPRVAQPARPITKPKSNACLLVFLIVGGVTLLIVVAVSLIAVPQINKGLARARMAEDLSNLKQIKYAIDSLAMDNDGLYPNSQTREFYELPNANPSTSNDYFRQLFASGNTNSERIFWVKGASVCNDNPPDDITASGGSFAPSQTLKAGDCGVAYVLNQKNTSNPERPILLSAFLAGTTDFDLDLYDGKVLCLRVDGSAKPHRLSPAGKLLDSDRDDLLDDAKCWDGTPPVIVQPAR